MNNNQLFDEHIREQFSDFAPDVHPRIWENIMAEKRKRRPAGFWFTLLNRRNILLLFGLLLAGGTGAWLFFKDSAASNTEKHIAQLPVNKTNSTIPDPSASTDNKNNGPVTGNTNTVTSGPVTTTVLQDPNSSTVNRPSHDLTAGKTSAPVTSVRIYSTAPQSTLTDGKEGANKKTEKVQGPVSKNNITDINKEEGELYSDNIPAQGSLLGRLMYGTQVIAAAKQQSGELKTHNLFGFLPGCPKFEKDATGNKKYIELYAGPDLAMRTLSDTGNSAYLQKRKESSKVSSA